MSDRKMESDYSKAQISVLEGAEEGKREIGDMVTEICK